MSDQEKDALCLANIRAHKSQLSENTLNEIVKIINLEGERRAAAKLEKFRDSLNLVLVEDKGKCLGCVGSLRRARIHLCVDHIELLDEKVEAIKHLYAAGHEQF